ncbi:MAG TPA: IPT/TIG domain-containing protein [Thermoanaerobaculia bacterium]|nr:IPT/TIG domain-containing protein [Thermoanaerobaculia bacterium]
MARRVCCVGVLLVSLLGGWPRTSWAQGEGEAAPPTARPASGARGECLPPTVSGVAPVFGAPGTPLVISGTNLDGTTAVTFAGTATSFTVTPPSRIETRVPQLQPGKAPVVVSKPCGSASAPFEVVAPAQSCVLGVVPQSLSFFANFGDTELPPQTISLTSFQPGVSFTAQEDSPFLDLGTAFGVTPAQLNVRANPTGLSVGGSATIRIACASGGGGAIAVPVTLSVSPPPPVGDPRIRVAPSSFVFMAPQGTNPAPQQLMVTSSEARRNLQIEFRTATFPSSRLRVDPPQGTTPQVLTVSVTSDDLVPFIYDFMLFVSQRTSEGPEIATWVPVRIFVTQPQPQCSVVGSPASLAFTAEAGGPNPPAQSVSLTSPQGNVGFIAAGGPPLVAVGSTSGNTPATLVVSVTTTNLAAGTYSGMAAVGCASAVAGGLQPIPVTVTVTAPGGELRAMPPMLSFVGTRGGPNPPAQTLVVSSTGTAVSFTAAASGSFLSVAPSGGTTPANLSASVNLAGLGEGSYSGTIMLASPGKPSVTVPVQLTVMPPPSLLMVSPTVLTFATTQDVDPPPRTLTILSSGAPLNWSVSSVGSFLTVGPVNGTTPSSTFVAPRAVALFPGTYTGAVNVTAPGTGSLSVPVTLVVTPF